MNLLIERQEVQKIVANSKIEKRVKILKWLSVDNFGARHKELQKKNSGQWFLESKPFKDWMDEIGPNCLLCPGIRFYLNNANLILAGAGKSTLI